MSNIKKHTDVVGSMEEFNAKYEQGVYSSPWIVYVGNDTDGYSVVYSNDEKHSISSATPDFIETITKRISALEEEKVFCYENEYDELVRNGSGWITNIDGTRSEVVYSDKSLYCIYEEDGPSNVE